MNPIIYLSQADADRVAKNEHNTFVMPLGEQPPEGYEIVKVNDGNVTFYISKGWSVENNPDPIIIPLRYSSGTYRLFAPTELFDLYDRTELPERNNNRRIIVPMTTEWELDVKTSVKRVQELTDEEIKHLIPPRDYMYVYKEDWVRQFNALHSKPVKTKGGKGYECFPYDMQTFEKWLSWESRPGEVLSDKDNNKWLWRGLPLTIHANCWVMVLECERRAV